MTEITNIEQIIESEVYSSIDSVIRAYQWQIDNQDKYHDWNKPSVAMAQYHINELMKKRELEATLIIEKTRLTIDELMSYFGNNYLVIYSKEGGYLSIHREKCEHYKLYVKKNDATFIKCKTFEVANKKAYSVIGEVQADIHNGCIECKPFWNLSSIKKSL